MPIIAPSVLAADFSNLEEQIKLADQGGADWIHLDIMDGHFVPNISFGPMVVEAVRKITDTFLDVHLMISDPDKYIPVFVDAGADQIIVHCEATLHLHRTLQLIKNYGIKAAVALNPATPISNIENIMDDLDMVLVMSVNPGFGGQKFIPKSLAKINNLADLINSMNKKIHIEVDGGVDVNNAGDITKAGANVLVAGSSVFRMPDIGKAIDDIRKAANSG